MLQGWKMQDMNLRHPCIFDRPVFSCLAFSVAPPDEEVAAIRRTADFQRLQLSESAALPPDARDSISSLSCTVAAAAAGPAVVMMITSRAE